MKRREELVLMVPMTIPAIQTWSQKGQEFLMSFSSIERLASLDRQTNIKVYEEIPKLETRIRVQEHLAALAEEFGSQHPHSHPS